MTIGSSNIFESFEKLLVHSNKYYFGFHCVVKVCKSIRNIRLKNKKNKNMYDSEYDILKEAIFQVMHDITR